MTDGGFNVKLKKYPKIKALGHKENQGIFRATYYITEKMDGCNFRFRMNKDGQLVFGTRNTVLGTIDFCGGYKDIAQYITDTIDMDKVNPAYTYFCEGGGIVGCHLHTIRYNNKPPAVGIDIYIHPIEGHEIQRDEGGDFMDWDVAAKHFEHIGLPMAYLIYKGDGHLTPEQVNGFVGQSEFNDGELTMEGIAIKRYDVRGPLGDPLFAKIVREEFKEQIKAQGGKKTLSTSEGDIADEYAVPPRIDKIIHKLLDDGHELEMKLMPVLYVAVMKDIFEEHFTEITRAHRVIDFKMLGTMIAKKCVIEIKNIMMERA